MTHKQFIKPFIPVIHEEHSERLKNGRISFSEDIIGSLVFEVLDNRPYVVGIQLLPN